MTPLFSSTTHLRHLACGMLAGFCATTALHADTLFHNARGYTLVASGDLVTFDAFAVNDAGKLMAVGTLGQLAAQAPNAARVNLLGKTVLPGLIDAHGHVLDMGLSAQQLSLRTARSLAEALQAVGSHARKNPARQWILGGEWNQANWKLGRFPTAAELDAVVPDRPVWLSRVDGHAGWANSNALSIAGISRSTPDPAGGKIERDAQGEPTGVLVDAAMGLLHRAVPQPNDAELRAGLDAALKTLASVGLTSVHDAGVSREADALFRSYADNHKLTVRVYGMISGVDSFFEAAAKSGPVLGYGNDHYALRAVKLFADGALGSRGAALQAPYSDAPATSGLLFNSNDVLRRKMARAVELGYQVNVHAIGDAGNAQVLNMLAALQPVNPPGTTPKIEANAGSPHADLRHRIEHAQVVAPADIPRFKALGVIPSMQPTHATSDMNMAQDRVGPQRIEGAYAWQTFLRQGSRIACGSDFPVESPNPFWGIHAAVTRQDSSNLPPGGWRADQAMTLKQALRCFTLDAAFAAHQEQKLGSLEPGKWADFIVIDQDPFKLPSKDLHRIKVLQTWVGGKRVFAQ